MSGMDGDMAIQRSGPPGPYGTESEAIAASRAGGWLVGTSHLEANKRRLDAAIQNAAIPLGSYDGSVLRWLSCWEPQTVEVIAALIERAAARDPKS